MTPALEKRIRDLVERLDDCFSLNAQAANLRGILHQQPKIRAIRKALAKQSTQES